MEADKQVVQPKIELVLNARMALNAYHAVENGIGCTDCLLERVTEGDPPDLDDVQAVLRGLHEAKAIVAMVSAGLCKEEGRRWPEGSLPPAE